MDVRRSISQNHDDVTPGFIYTSCRADKGNSYNMKRDILGSQKPKNTKKTPFPFPHAARKIKNNVSRKG